MVRINPIQVPGGWQLVRLDEVAEVIGGSTPSRSVEEYWGGSIPWVVPSELTELSGRYLSSTRDCITDLGMKAARLKLLPPKSILLTSRATVGVTAMNTIPVCTNQGFQNLVARDGVDPLWLFYHISAMREELKKRAAGSTFDEISGDSVRSLPILLPSTLEQCTIGVVLDSIDRTIEQTEAVIIATERLRDAVLYELLTRGIPGWHTAWQNVPGVGIIPVDWQITTLDTIAEIIMGQSPPGTTVLDWDGEVIEGKGLPFIQGNAEFCEQYPVPTKWCVEPVKVAKSGDILLSVRAPVGDVNIADQCLCIGRGLAALRFIGMTPAFGWYDIQVAKYRIERLTQGSTFKAISKNEIQRLPVAIPALVEQQAIVAVLNSIDKCILELRREFLSLKSLMLATSFAMLLGHVECKK